MGKKEKKQAKLKPADWKTFEFESSNIKELKYDKANEILHTTFNTGKTYEYTGVSIEIWKKLKKAESVGSEHHRLIVASGFQGKFVD